jgi:hypothetical protein
MNGFPLTIRKQPSGETFWIHVEPTYRISTCKQKIQRMRGIPGDNIRLGFPKESSSSCSEQEDEDSIGDDFQQQTLASLGLIAPDPDSDSEANGIGPTLDITPITLYVQTPTGMRIKLKESIDVEATVGGIEEMVACELESAHLLDASESSNDSNEERFRLYHGRMPMQRGNKITKYKIKHMDILKLKFGTDQASASQKEERKKAFRKSEAHQKLDNKRCNINNNNSNNNNNKLTKKSPSAENLRRVICSGASRAATGIPREEARKRLSNHSCSANEAIQKQQQQYEAPIRKIMRYCSSEKVLERLSQSFRSSGTTPEEEPALRRKSKARRSSDPAIVAKLRSRSGSAGKKAKKKQDDIIQDENSNAEQRRRSSLKKKTTDGEATAQKGRRSHSNGHLEGRSKKSRSKSRSRVSTTEKRNQARDNQTAEPRRRKKNDDENEKAVEQRRRNSLSSNGRNEKSSFEVLQDVRSSSNKSEAQISKRRSRSGSRKKSATVCRTRARSDSINNTKKRSEEGHPCKSWQEQSSSSNIQNNIPAQKAQAKKDDACLGPFAIAISSHKTNTTKNPTESDEKGCSPSSPVSVVTETLNVSHLFDECSEGSSDIQSHEIDISVFSELTSEEDFKDKEMVPPSKTKPVSSSSTTEVTSTLKDDDKLLAFMRVRKENKNKTNNAKANKNTSQPKRMSLQELKEAKAREETKEFSRVSQFDSKPVSFNTADFRTSSKDVMVAVVDRDRTNVQERKHKIDANTINANKNTTKPKRTSLRELKKNTSPRNEKTISAVTKTKTETKTDHQVVTDAINISEDATEKPKKEIPLPSLPSIVSKAKFEKESPAPNPTMPERQHKEENRPRSPVAVATKPKTEIPKYSSSEISAKEAGAVRTIAENQSVVRLAKAKFEKENQATQSHEFERQHKEKRYPESSEALREPQMSLLARKISGEGATEKIAEEDTAAKHQTQTTTPKRRRKSRNSIGLPEKVINELKDTLHRKSDEEKATAEAAAKPEKSIFNQIASNAPTIQANAGMTIRPLPPSLKGTPSSRNSSNGSSAAQSAAEATAKLENSIADENAANSVNPQSKTTPSINSPAFTKASIKDRIWKFQTEGKENANAPESVNDGIRKFQAGGKESANTKAPRSVNDRIKKFQTRGMENANSSGFQMIGLQTLGLKNVVAGGTGKNDDDSAYSFFRSDEEKSDYEDSDSSDSEDDSSFFDEFNSIHIIGPDLIPFEIQIDSDAEKLGDIKEAFSEASGIPVDELRFVIQSDESDIEEGYRITLDDDFRLTPGDILAVQPSTVVVKLPDGNSKLELSVFPGTLLIDIKDYIAESTGTPPSRQLLYNFEKNFSEELEDDTPISTDCTLRLTLF